MNGPRDKELSARATDIVARDVERAWMYWRALITELQDTMAQRDADDAGDASLLAADTPRVRVARIPADTRQIYLQVIESRRAAAQATAERNARAANTALPDPDIVYTHLLATMEQELRGQTTPNGHAVLWYEGTQITFDSSGVTQSLTDTDYQPTGAPQFTPVQMAFGAVGAVVLLLLAFFLVSMLFATDTPARTEALEAVAVGAGQVPVWDVQAIAVAGSSVDGRLQSTYPATLCVGAEDRESVTPGATLVLTGTGSIRRYQVQSAPGARTDLQITLCSDTARRDIAQALLLDTQTRVMLPPDAVEVVSVRGSDLAPDEIPAAQMEVTIQTTRTNADAGVLVLADGSRWSATRSEAPPGGRRYIYLVPAARVPQSVAWEVLQDAAPPLLAAFTLPAPMERSAVLQRDVIVSAAAATRTTGPEGDTLDLRLDVTVRDGAPPLQFRDDDFLALVDGVPARVRWTPPMVQSATVTSVTVVILLSEPDRPLTLSLADWRVQVQPAAE